MKHTLHKTGFTLLELIISILISSILFFSIAIMMEDTQRSWSDTYAKVHGGAVADAIMSKTVFNNIVRKSMRSAHTLHSSDDLTVYYYEDWKESTESDRSARFYRSPDNPSEMYIEHLDEDNSVISTVRLASNVTDLEFVPISNGYTMRLLLDDGREQITVISTAIMHNN